MRTEQIKIKHKAFCIAQREMLRKELDAMRNEMPHQRHLNEGKYLEAMDIWRKRYNELTHEYNRILEDWKKGVDFIY